MEIGILLANGLARRNTASSRLALRESLVNFDDAYANGKYIAGAEIISDSWLPKAASFRDQHSKANLDLAYGAHSRQVMDIFYPDQTPLGLAVFIHGGYWMKLDKNHWSHLARGALSHGYAVMMPTYRLAPEAGIDEIKMDVAAAVTVAASMVGGPIMLSGHSAGGHLATRLIAHDGVGAAVLDDHVLSRIARVTSISGVHDLRPLMQTKMNDILGIDDRVANAESPVLLRPVPGIMNNEVILTCHVGENERPEFRRQNDVQAIIWGGLGLCTDIFHEPDKHHFDVIDDLMDGDSRLTKSFVGLAFDAPQSIG